MTPLVLGIDGEKFDHALEKIEYALHKVENRLSEAP